MASRLEILLVVVGLALTGIVCFVNIQNNTELAEQEFQRLVDESAEALSERMKGNLQTVRGTAAYISASDDVTLTDFKNYVDALEIETRLPSLMGLGYVVEVPDAELDAFVSAQRAAGRPDFEIRRRSDRDLHTIIKYIEPVGENSNAKAVGLDLSFSTERAEVLTRGRETNQVQMTPPVQLVQEDKTRPGFVTYMPIFSKANETGAPAVFTGWVNAPFVADNLLQRLTLSQGQLYALQASDVSTVQGNVPIFDGLPDISERGKFSLTREMHHFGRTWMLTFNSTDRFDTLVKSYQPLTFLIEGLALTAFLLLVLRHIQERAERLRDTARQSARQAEARAEENRSIVENAVISVLVLDANGTVLVANQAARKCFGFTDAEMNDKSFDALVTEIADPEGSHNAVGKTKTGQVLELDLHCNKWRTSEGEQRTTAIIRDLTDQNKAERELKRHKSLNDMALQGSEIGVFDVDLNTGMSDVSETWCRLMGFDGDCNGMDTQQIFLERVHPDDLILLKDADQQCIDGLTERSTAEYRLKSLDGNWRWMRSDAVVVERDKDGKALRLIGTQIDVTDLRRDRIALEASERQFRQVLASAPIGMALMNDSGKFTGVNKAFCQLTGREESELVNGVDLAELMPDEDRKVLYRTIAQMMEDGSSSIYTAEHRILGSTDEERWGLVNVSWSFDRNARSNFFIAQIIDITDQKKLDLVKNEFVSTVSHELRTPLTSIKGALGLLTASKGSNLTSGQERLIEIAESNAGRLTDIVNDILDLEKISSGEISFEFDELDLAEVIENAALEMAPFATTHESSLRVDMPEDTLSVHADMGRTKQVLANLISNACKYSDPNSEVLIKAERLDDMAIIYIQNTGQGVPESFKSRIFKAFSQADSSDTRAKGGTGLGLNISRQIVLRHGGQIGYESIANGVTVFWFTMPLTENVLKSEPQVHHTRDAHANGKLSVLHVEDDHDFAEIVAEALDDFAEVSHVKSIASARQFIGTDLVDVVILDWGLPDGDADQLLEDILRAQPDVQVIALSADAERENDPRLVANMIKGRTDLATVAAEVNRCQALAS
ncbi:CHASE domain-containing protein [Sulfitobacter geojensis]|uniref:CHASE domain-containing protein n=1 Tax=Sulfitobacter geojensis TaxID=1342299 RepID=UPI0036D86981